MNQLEILIKSQEEQEERGNLTPTGIAYLNGLRTAMKIQKENKSNSNDDKILHWEKQLEAVINVKWLINHIK